MRKKLMTSLFIVFFAAALCTQAIPLVFAESNPTVYWTKTGKDKMAVQSIPWPNWFNFTVANTGDAIIRFKFVIPKNQSELAWFRFTQSDTPSGWTATPDEFDGMGWPTVIIFDARTAPGIDQTTGPQKFAVRFILGPAFCNYDFPIYTVDTRDVTNLRWLYLEIDNVKPKVEIHAPADGQTVKAIWNPYPLKHYVWINITATDDVDPLKKHNTGISTVKIYFDNKLIKTLTDVTKPISEQYYGLDGPIKEGTHTVKAEAWDGVGNAAVPDENKFTYEIPKLFKITPDKGTVGPTTTFDEESELYVGSIYSHGKKTLGTLITVEGLPPAPPLSKGFTPKSTVTISVEDPIRGSAEVLRLKTGDKGEFKGSFYMITVPYGTYMILARDLGGVSDYSFFTVDWEIIYKPEIVTGPAVIEAKATGLTSDGYIDRFMIDDTDALLSVDWHSVEYWTSTEFGVLTTSMAPKPGFLLPLLENGAYNISLRIVNGRWWDGTAVEGGWEPFPNNEQIVFNIVHVANDFESLLDAMDSLKKTMDELKPTIERIDNNIADIVIPDVGTIKADVKKVIADMTILMDGIVQILTKLGTIEGKIDTIAANVILIKTDVGLIKAKTDTIVWGNITTIKTDVGDIKVKLADFSSAQIAAIKKTTDDTLANTNQLVSTTTLGTPIAAVLSAVAAIAAIAAAVVVTRRLKVAA